MHKKDKLIKRMNINTIGLTSYLPIVGFIGDYKHPLCLLHADEMGFVLECWRYLSISIKYLEA